MWGYSALGLQNKVDRVNANNLAALPDPSALPAFTYTPVADLPTSRGVTTMPDIPYPINGSTDLVKFLGANLMANNWRMDASAYLDKDSSVTLLDAAGEALQQNPYTFGGAVTYQTKGDLIWFDYYYNGDDFVDAMPALRAQLLEKGQSIVASITNGGMSERQKALAINNWLVNNATYDYPAYDDQQASGSDPSYIARHPYAFNAPGVMLLGTGVCSSYAPAFKLMADLAGVTSVTVTGTVSTGGSHAWNKAVLDGVWRVIDTTWDDNPYDTTMYFGITDAAADRTEDTEWMVDQFIPQYAAA